MEINISDYFSLYARVCVISLIAICAKNIELNAAYIQYHSSHRTPFAHEDAIMHCQREESANGRTETFGYRAAMHI